MSVTPKLKSSSIETNATTDVSDLPDHEPTLNARLVTLAKFFGSGVLILAVFHFNDVASGIVWSFKHFQVIFSILAKTCISPSMQQVSELQTALASYVGGSVAGISQTLADWVTIEANTVLSLWTNFTTYISKLGYIASFALAVLAAAALLYFRQQWKESVQDVVHRKAASSAPKSKPMKEDEKVEYAGLWNFNSSVRVSAPKPAQVKETSKTLKLVESLTSSKDSKPIKLTSEQRSMLQDRVSTLWNFEGVSSEGIRQATPQDASVFLSIMTDEELVIAKSKLEDEVRGLWNFGTPVLTDVERVQDKKESAMKAQVAELWDFQRASSVGLRSEVVKLPLVSKSDLSPVEIERLEKEVAVLWDFTPQVIDNEEYEKFVAKMRRRNVPNPVAGVAGGFEDSKSGWLKSFIAGQLGGSKVPRQQQLTSNQRQELQNEISILWNFEQVSDKGEVKMKNRDVSSFLNVMSDEELALARAKLEQEVRGLWNFDVRVKTDTEQRVAEERADLEEKVSLLWDFKTPEQAEKDKAAASILQPVTKDEKEEYAGLWNFNSSVRVSAPNPAQVKETSWMQKLVESLTSSKDSKPIKLTSEQRSMLQDRVSTLWNFEGVSSEGIRQATPQDASVFLSIMTDEELVIAKSKLEDEVRGLWNFGTPVLTDVEGVQDKKESAMKAQVAELWDFQRASSVGLRSEVVKLPLVSKSDLSPVEIERLEKEVAVLWDFTPQVIDNEEYEKFVAKMRRRNVPNPVAGVAGGFEDSKSGWLKSFIAGQLGGSKVPRQQQLTSNQRQELQNEISILWNFEQVSDKGEVKMKNRDVSSFLNVMSDEELALAREKLEQEVRGLWNFDVRVKTDTEQRVAEERADLEEKVSLLWDFKTPEQAEKDKAAASINQMQLAKEAEEERKRKLNAMVNAKRLKQAQLEDAAMQERLARKESSNRKAVDAMWDFQIVSTKGDKPPVVNSVGIFSSPSVQSATLSEEDKKESEEHSAGVWAFETVKSDGQKQSERVAADQEEFSSILWDFKPVSDVSSSPAALQKKKQGTPTGRLNLDDQLLQKTEADSLWNFEIPKSVGNMMEVKTPTPQSKVYSSKFNLGQTESDAMLKAQREEYAETLNMGTPVSSAMGKGKVEPKSGGVLSKETMEFKTDMSDEEKDQQKLEVADLWKFDVVKSEREKKAAKIVAEHKASSAIWNSKSVSTEDKPKDNPKSDSSSGWLGRVFSASKNSPKSDLTNKEKQKLKDDTAELWNFEEVKNKDMEKEMTGSKVETSSGASPDLLKVKSESVVVSDSFGKNGK
eukprot:CAMPEP_0196598726 /NCGR_PEP_ID=MMETSP1081-20130531/94472_1 /TAXON_ID=36882 /ORGANISM="Pyramimonas amylifera, Strain CCMP720" /LENGTH=1289 /DNA_ID=CAMNT_0041924443 /DNA_START=351 /DNA_END=4220 /DNA_ORIENTATION=+